MRCPVCLDEPNPPAQQIDHWFRSLGLNPPEPSRDNTLSLKEATSRPWYPAPADSLSRSARLAFARALIEVRFELRRRALESASDVLDALQTWFGGVSSCLTRINSFLNPRRPEYVRLLAVIQAAESLTPIFDSSHLATLKAKATAHSPRGALVGYLASNTFGTESVAGEFIRSSGKQSGLRAAVFDETAISDARAKAPPPVESSKWNNEQEVLGFEQGTLVLVWLGDLLECVLPASDTGAVRWEKEALKTLQLGHGAVLLALWCQRQHPVCDACVKRLLAAAALYRAYLFSSLLSGLEPLIRERQLRRSISEAVAEGRSRGNIYAPEFIGYPLLLWWSEDGGLDAVRMVRDGPGTSERLKLHWGFSEWLEGENCPGRAVSIAWPFNNDKGDRNEARARLLLLHLAEKHGKIWPLQGGECFETALASCTSSCGQFFDQIKAVTESWDRVLRRALPAGYENLVEYDQNGNVTLRLRGPFFVGMKGSLSRR